MLRWILSADICSVSFRITSASIDTSDLGWYENFKRTVTSAQADSGVAEPIPKTEILTLVFRNNKHCATSSVMKENSQPWSSNARASTESPLSLCSSMTAVANRICCRCNNDLGLGNLWKNILVLSTFRIVFVTTQDFGVAVQPSIDNAHSYLGYVAPCNMYYWNE